MGRVGYRSGGGLSTVRARAARRLYADVVKSGGGRDGGDGRRGGRVHGDGRLVAEPLAGRRVVAFRARRVRGGVVEEAQVESVRGAGAERHVGRELVGRRRATQTRRQRLVELEHVHVAGQL